MDLTTPTPPTSFLPPLSRLLSYSSRDIEASLFRLQAVYWPANSPAVLRNRLVQRLVPSASVVDSGYASANEEEDDDGDDDTTAFPRHSDQDVLEILRSDPFEKTYVLKWLTGFVCRSDDWASAENVEEEESELRFTVVDFASTILARFSGQDEEEEAACELTRCFTFPADSSFSTQDITVELNDAPLSSTDHTSVGLQSWGSCILLGRALCANPTSFGLVNDKPLRILELGAGTGLLSIAAAKLLATSSSPVYISATDYHPDVLTNLRRNIRTNFSSSDTVVHVEALDWERPPTIADDKDKYDIILAADVIYSPSHARWIRNCIEVLLHPHGICTVIMAIRQTGRHEGLYKTVDEAFGSQSAGKGGKRLRVVKTEDLEKERGIGRADEAVYRVFQVGLT
ncbi:putative methyltransferase-domain-containing protein [Flagelloscypha sp. PMI_526]|nr:putative methyltransferase-domain-containing protein [Flagelloscypha sp. PMI_526]